MNLNDFISVDVASKKYNISKRELYRWCENRLVSAYRKAGKGGTFIEISSLEAKLNERKKKNTQVKTHNIYEKMLREIVDTVPWHNISQGVYQQYKKTQQLSLKQKKFIETMYNEWVLQSK